MLLTISTTFRPASVLGYLLHKNPANVQSFDLSFGQAHVFYPECSEERCTAALLLDVDCIGLIRNKKGAFEGYGLTQYVNDRPYVASSFLSVAIAQVFGTALGGRSKEKQEIADSAIPLEATLSVVPCRRGEQFLAQLFEPLGYEMSVQRVALDDGHPEWGESHYFTVSLKATTRLRDLLSHLYVLVPVLDNEKHYYVGEEEVEKLLKHGKEWLSAHPARQLITERYLRYRRNLTRQALSQLSDEDDIDPDSTEEKHLIEEAEVEEKISLNEQRLGTVLAVLRKFGATNVIDMGCGEGRLLDLLMEDKTFTRIVGVDVSQQVLEKAQRRLKLNRLNEHQSARITLIQGALTYRDKRFSGFDAATCIEVIEHLDLPRLHAFERVLFEFARPQRVIVTTPNSEYNVKFDSLPAGKFRHRDHRFEWNRAEFRNWSDGVANRHGYKIEFLPVGPEDDNVGAPTQMGVFSLP